MRIFLLTLFILLHTASAFSQQSSITKVLILGTPHLQQIEGTQKNFLERLLDTLRKKNFDVIAIESMPPELLLDIRSRSGEHWQELYGYYKKGVEFGLQHQTNINLSYENAKVNLKRLNQIEELSDTESMEYVNSFLCTYDVWSALLHYKKLEDKSKLNRTVIDLLESFSDSKNEINLVGLELANQLYLRQVVYIDDLQDETILLSEFPDFMTEYEFKSETIAALFDRKNFNNKALAIEEDAITNQDFYELYKFYNSEEYKREDYDAQWALWFETNFDSKSDLSRYYLWELRNLKITANILRTIATYPGKNILVIIGASHRSFIEKYLSKVPQVEMLSF